MLSKLFAEEKSRVNQCRQRYDAERIRLHLARQRVHHELGDLATDPAVLSLSFAAGCAAAFLNISVPQALGSALRLRSLSSLIQDAADA